jgi:hypothetical protein
MFFAMKKVLPRFVSELNLWHEPLVERSQSGMKRLDHIFGRTQSIVKRILR